MKRIAVLIVGIALVVWLLATGMASAEDVTVSAQAPAPTELQLTFEINVFAAPSGGTMSPTSIDFGPLVANTPKTGIHNLGVSTNASNGYSVTVQENDQLRSAMGVIEDVRGDDGLVSHLTAGPWISDATVGFGYTLANAVGTAATFTSGYKQFPCAGQAEAAQPVMTNVGPTAVDRVRIEYKVNIGPAQAQGTYTNTLTYIATGTL
jgi:hypothetical protein